MKLLKKELKLAASPLSFIFPVSAFFALVPGYPILMSAFFTTLGIFYSFQTMRENNDIQYSLLLPVAKADIVKSKFAFTLFIEACGFVPAAVLTAVRMLFLSGAKVYTSNALMSANLTFLGFALIIFGLFNLVFVGGFFKTAYYFGKPFIIYCVLSLAVIVLAETLHHIPGLEALDSPDFGNITLQLPAFVVGLFLFVLFTALAVKKSKRLFEKTDT